MSDTNPNEHKMSKAEARNLKETFEAVQAGTSEPGEFAEALRDALGLAENTDWQEVVLKHFKPGTDAYKLLERELEVSRAEVATMKGERDAEKVSAAIQSAISKAGIGQENIADATAILRGVMEVKDGKVVTKTSDGVVPGQTADQFIAGQLKTMRPHYWPKSIGGGAKGGGYAAHAGPDLSSFRPGGRLTDQYAVINRVGEKVVIDSLRRAGIVPPAYLTNGGGR